MQENQKKRKITNSVDYKQKVFNNNSKSKKNVVSKLIKRNVSPDYGCFA